MSVIRRFGQDRNGTTAVLFGLAALPLMAMVGAAVDYSRAATEKTKMQLAADATALMLAREPRTASAGELQSRAAAIFANLYAPAPGVAADELVATRSGDVVTVTRRARMTNAFMQVVGVPQTPIGSQATAAGGTERIELALVLDNTGSMDRTIDGSRKIDELKRVATDLVDKLKAMASDKDAVRVSVVPFDTEVRVEPATYRNRDWIRWDNPLSVAERNAWTGYIVDRDQPNDILDVSPVLALQSTLYRKLQKSDWASSGNGDLAYVRPLASVYGDADAKAAKDTIAAMRPRGNTNVGLGVAWGTATLTGSVPLDAIASRDARKVRRFMVVLTDGTNTQSWVNGVARTVRNPGDPDASDPVLVAINQRTAKACETAKDPKNAGIEVFTIRLMEGDQTLLGNCASPPNERIKQHYFDVQSKPQLEKAFRDILDGIGQMRITS